MHSFQMKETIRKTRMNGKKNLIEKCYLAGNCREEDRTGGEDRKTGGRWWYGCVGDGVTSVVQK